MKAIPAEISGFAEKHTLLMFGGAAVIAYMGYSYIHAHNTVAAVNPTVVPASAPIDYSSLTSPVSSGTGVIDSISNPNVPSPSAAPNATGSSLDWAMFNLEQQKEADSFTLAMDQLSSQVAMAAASNAISAQAIQASNWSTSAGLAQAFLVSGAPFMAGSVGGQTFAFLSGQSARNTYSGKNQKQVMAQQQSQFSQFLQMFGSNLGATVPTANGGSSSSYVGSSSTASMQSGGGSGTTSVSSGGGSSGAQSSASYSGSAGGGTGTSRLGFSSISSA